MDAILFSIIFLFHSHFALSTLILWSWTLTEPDWTWLNLARPGWTLAGQLVSIYPPPAQLSHSLAPSIFHKDKIAPTFPISYSFIIFLPLQTYFFMNQIVPIQSETRVRIIQILLKPRSGTPPIPIHLQVPWSSSSPSTSPPPSSQSIIIIINQDPPVKCPG